MSRYTRESRMYRKEMKMKMKMAVREKEEIVE